MSKNHNGCPVNGGASDDALERVLGSGNLIKELGLGADSVLRFDDLNAGDQEILLYWVREVLVPAENGGLDSYKLRQDFEVHAMHKTRPLHGAIKGAMVCLGYEPVNPSERAWKFEVGYRGRWPGVAVRLTFEEMLP